MSHKELTEREMFELLSPLRELEPASRTRPAPRARRLLGWRLVPTVAALMALSAGAAGAGLLATGEFRSGDGVLSVDEQGRALESTRPLGPGGRFACMGIEGMSATKAQRFFNRRGIGVQWRSERMNSRKEGFTSSPVSAPAGSVVHDIAWSTPTEMIVFVHRRGAPFSQTLETPPSCP